MSKAAGRAIGAGVGAAGGEMLDPFKKGKDKSPLTAGLVGGALGAATPAVAKGLKKANIDYSAGKLDTGKGSTIDIKPKAIKKDPLKTDFNTSRNKNIA